MLIDVKMPTLLAFLTFMSIVKYMLSRGEHGNSFITYGPDNETCVVNFRTKTGN